MLLRVLGGVSLLATLAAAQSRTTDSAPTETKTQPPATITVKVGPDGHTFVPDSVQANVSDVIRFHFFEHDHSVARAEYMVPCQPIEYTSPEKIGFWSDFQIVETRRTDGPFYDVTVNDTEPIFYYCSQVGACSPDAMVGVINPSDTQSLSDQIAAARKAKVTLSPGDPIPKEGEGLRGKSSNKLSGGAIAGIVVGSVAFVAIIGILLYLFVRNRSLASILRYSRPPQGRTAPLPQAGGPPSPYNPPSAPYSPGFQDATKYPSMATAQATGHESWMSGAPTAVGPASPMMSDDGYGNMRPVSFVPPPFNPHHSYAPVGSPPLNYKPQPSPGETPWSPGGFAFAPQQQQQQQQQQQYPQQPQGMDQIATGGEHAGAGAAAHNGYPPMSYQAAPAELDAHSSDAMAASHPPQYRPPALSTTAGGAEPVQKPEDKSPTAHSP